MKPTVLLLFLASAAVVSSNAFAHPVDDSNVIWNSPSKDAAGSISSPDATPDVRTAYGVFTGLVAILGWVEDVNWNSIFKTTP
jgi:hypothetical protein